MMLDIGGFELLVIGVVALIVVGPKELPGLVRSVGRWAAKARNLAREFQSGMEEAAKDAELDDLRKVGSIKSDLEKQVRDMGRSAQTSLDAARGAPASPAERNETSTTARAKGDKPRVEPSFDDGRDPFSEGDDPVDRFQQGMGRGS